MSHVTCPKCGSNEHQCGYGFAAGPLGSYTFCEGCDELIEFAPDTEGLDEMETAMMEAMAENHLRDVWGDKYASPSISVERSP